MVLLPLVPLLLFTQTEGHSMVELPVTVHEQNNQKGIAVVFATILLVIPFLISGLQLNHGHPEEDAHPE